MLGWWESTLETSGCSSEMPANSWDLLGSSSRATSESTTGSSASSLDSLAIDSMPQPEKLANTSEKLVNISETKE